MRRIRLTQDGDDLFMVLRYDVRTWGCFSWPETRCNTSYDNNGNVQIEPGLAVAFIRNDGRVVHVREQDIDRALESYGCRRAR